MLDLFPQLAVLQEQAYDRGPLLIAASVASVFAGQNGRALSTAAKGSHLRIPGGKLTVSALNTLAVIALKSISASFLLGEGTVPGPGPPLLPSSTIPLDGLSATATFFDPQFQPVLHESVLFVAGITLATGAGVLLVLKRGVFIVELGNSGGKRGGKKIRGAGRKAASGKASGSGQAPDGEPGDGEVENGDGDKAEDSSGQGGGGSPPPPPPPPDGGGNEIEPEFPANGPGIPLWQLLLMLAGLGLTTREVFKITRAWVKKRKSGRVSLPRLPKLSVNFTLGYNTSDTLSFVFPLDAASVLITSDIPNFLSTAPPAALRLAPLAIPEVINSRPVQNLIEFVASTLNNVNFSPIYPNPLELPRVCAASPRLIHFSPNLLPIQLAQKSLHSFNKAIVGIPLSPPSFSTSPAPPTTLAHTLPTTLANALPAYTLSKLLPTTTTLASILPSSSRTVPEAYRRFTLSAPLPKASLMSSLKIPLSKSAITKSLLNPTTTLTPTLINTTPTPQATLNNIFKASTTTLESDPKSTVIKWTFVKVNPPIIRYRTTYELPTKCWPFRLLRFPLRLLRPFFDRYPCSTVTCQVVRVVATAAAACVVIMGCKLLIAFLQWIARLERERHAARFEEIREPTSSEADGQRVAPVEERVQVSQEEVVGRDEDVTLYVDEQTGIMEPDVVLPSHVSLDFEDAFPAYGFSTSTPRANRVMSTRLVEAREEVGVAQVEIDESVVEHEEEASEGYIVDEDSVLERASVEVNVSEDCSEVEERAGAEVVDVDAVCGSEEEEEGEEDVDSQASEACSGNEEEGEEEEEEESGSSVELSGEDEEEDGEEEMDSSALAAAEVEDDNEEDMVSSGLVEVAVDHDEDEDNNGNDDDDDEEEEEMTASDVPTGEDEDEDVESSCIAVEEEEEDGDDNISSEAEEVQAEVYETVATVSVSVEDTNGDVLYEDAEVSLEPEVAIDAQDHIEPEHDAEPCDTSNVLADLEKVEKKPTPKWKTLMDELNIAPPVRYPDLFDGETDTKKIVRGLLDGLHKKRAAPIKQNFDDDDEEVPEVIEEEEEERRLIERLDSLYEEAVETKASFSAEFEQERSMIAQQWGLQHEWLNRDRPRLEDRLSTAGAGRSRGDPQTV